MQISRAAGVVEAQFDEVRVLLNDDLDYLGLDEVGQRIWDLLAAPQTIDSLIGALTAEYDVSADECARDVESFVDALERYHLVSTS
jgi:hypothetical protein